VGSWVLITVLSPLSTSQKVTPPHSTQLTFPPSYDALFKPINLGNHPFTFVPWTAFSGFGRSGLGFNHPFVFSLNFGFPFAFFCVGNFKVFCDVLSTVRFFSVSSVGSPFSPPMSDAVPLFRSFLREWPSNRFDSYFVFSLSVFSSWMAVFLCLLCQFPPCGVKRAFSLFLSH